MIDRGRWVEAMRERLCEDADFDADAETAGFHIPQRGSLVLHEEETASLMRLVSEEAAHDTEELLMQAQRLDEYARNLAQRSEAGGEAGEAGEAGEDLSLPLSLYASATPSGRLVANFCACSPFDETDEALAALDKFLHDNPLEGEAVR